MNLINLIEEFSRPATKDPNSKYYYRYEAKYTRNGKMVQEGIYTAIGIMPNVIPAPLLPEKEELEFYFTELGKKHFMKNYNKIRKIVKKVPDFKLIIKKKRINSAHIFYKDQYQIAAHRTKKYKRTETFKQEERVERYNRKKKA